MTDKFSRLFRVLRTTTQMLDDRGYIPPRNDVREMKIEEFMNQFPSGEPRREDLTMLVQRKDDPTEQLFVFFPEDAKVGVKPIRTYADRMRTEKVKCAILVVQAKMTSFAKNAMASLGANYEMEQFLEDELLVNITEHILVPKHIVLSDEEKKDLLSRYKLKPEQLPRIQLSDPVSRYYGLKRGNVVKIIRPSETAGRYVTYRQVV